MVVLCKPVRFIAHILQQPQRPRMLAENFRFRLTRQKDLFLAFGERANKWGRHTNAAQCRHGGPQLPLAAIDQQNIGKCFSFLLQPSKVSADDFAHRREIVDAVDRADLESFVTVLERKPVNELDATGNGFSTLEMRNVHSFDATRQRRQFEYFLQTEQSAARIDLKYFRLRVLFQIPSQIQVFQGLDLIAQAGCLFKL